jgi:hypothetical protein
MLYFTILFFGGIDNGKLFNAIKKGKKAFERGSIQLYKSIRKSKLGGR